MLELTLEEIGIFQHLRNLRKQIADEQEVPPYVVFPDSSLRAMARLRPQSRAQFAKIPGVGNRKLEAFFTAFTDAIRDYCEQHDLQMGLAEKETEPEKESAVAPHISAGPSTHQLTLELYNEGKSVEEIARERDLKPRTIMNHLVELIEVGETLDVEPLIQTGHYEVIVDALQQVGSDLLKPVKELLGDEYSYEEIRLVRALMRRAQ